jgi:hypothetical protein
MATGLLAEAIDAPGGGIGKGPVYKAAVPGEPVRERGLP